ncbi:hypothetical protein FQ087_06140 [Sporosarcina sp. ANT_H38]|uniref:hypothetical protein n=1 Tax=Sporosarcina sp. ANT_H38 TaxID=2597358 RepID=UPI0011F365CE|nr:hypothetical protein [Sporosarcina sp. ANT_H38]KAA0965844.1 hypothetical protein FQ087_06140 [Sporosarcina sp. ANT_H38]
MLFTIDTGNILEVYRMKKNSLFEKVDVHPKVILEDDKVFTEFNEAKEFAGKLEFAVINGEEVDFKSSQIGSYNAEVKPHRTEKPSKELFSIDEVRNILNTGDDSINNSLIIDFDGNLKLVPFKDAIKGNYAVRHETFGAGNGYVGPDQSESHIESTYLMMLDGWEAHLDTHDSHYMDYTDKTSAEKLIKNIKELLQEV